MGRTKKISDSDILLVAFNIISHDGFESFTLKQVGKATGLSPAALIKRFKTKKNLAFLARNEKWDQNLGKINSEVVDQLKGLGGIFEFLSLVAKSVNSKRLSEHIRWLGKEAEDLRTKKKVGAYFADTRQIFYRLIQEAISKNEIKFLDNPEDFAMTLEALLQGAIFQFAFLNTHNIERHLKDRFRSALKEIII